MSSSYHACQIQANEVLYNLTDYAHKSVVRDLHTHWCLKLNSTSHASAESPDKYRAYASLTADS